MGPEPASVHGHGDEGLPAGDRDDLGSGDDADVAHYDLVVTLLGRGGSRTCLNHCTPTRSESFTSMGQEP